MKGMAAVFIVRGGGYKSVASLPRNRRESMAATTGSSATLVLGGHFFSVVHEASDAVLQLVLHPDNGWLLYLLQHGEVLAERALVGLTDIVLGFAAGHRAAPVRNAPSCNYCTVASRCRLGILPEKEKIEKASAVVSRRDLQRKVHRRPARAGSQRARYP